MVLSLTWHSGIDDDESLLFNINLKLVMADRGRIVLFNGIFVMMVYNMNFLFFSLLFLVWQLIENLGLLLIILHSSKTKPKREHPQ